MASHLARFWICLAALCSSAALADEGGVSFWLPGQFGSLAAAPQVPGWQFATINYFASAKASGNVAAAKEISIGRFNSTPKVNLNVDLVSVGVLRSPDLCFRRPIGPGDDNSGRL